MTFLLAFERKSPFIVDLEETLLRKRASKTEKKADIGVWHVCADWFDDQNEPETASFIRKYAASMLEVVRRVNRGRFVIPTTKLPGQWELIVFVGNSNNDPLPLDTVRFYLHKPKGATCEVLDDIISLNDYPPDIRAMHILAALSRLFCHMEKESKS